MRPIGTPGTEWNETVLPDEDRLVADFLRTIRQQQEDTARDGRTLRGFHAKIHLGAEAAFHVLPDLPDFARQGVFREPATYPAVVRFSNGHFRVNPDSTKEPRGIAIKLLGVHGARLPGHDAATQDFLATSHSLTSTVRDIRQFVAVVEATRGRDKPRFGEMARRLGLREALRILVALVRTVSIPSVHSMATERFGGTAPVQWGPYAAKFTVQPAEGTAPHLPRARTPDFLREELAERLRAGDLAFDFMAQFFVDDRRTPIEDTSVAWNSEAVRVAQLVIPRCDVDGDAHARRTSEAIERLAFSPWHGLADHRPLGSVMRARRTAYEASAAFRTHDPEPDSLPLVAPGEPALHA
ncbi:hypothetical protein [Longimicrobium sp.]|uniref:hypothetical protein n=1 Tax=Longimicrobium sp. TaxID=2029185 RepID=UPI002E3142FB|nr:hypothetical protein [Longimicrobium sp.]HEX6042532.1 hypothetical protein [Longimicrobium sp.]